VAVLVYGQGGQLPIPKYLIAPYWGTGRKLGILFAVKIEL